LHCTFDAQDAPTRGMAIRDFLRANWHVVTVGTTATAIFFAALLLLQTMPPGTVVMATGSEGGAYHEIGKQYQAALMRAGENLRLFTTAGSVENLALLRDPHSGVNVALIQSGTIKGDQGSGLESLGTLFYEPLWIFHRSELQGLTLENVRGLRVSIGPAGSGTSALALELLNRNGLTQRVGELLALEPQAAADQLLAGQIDVAFIIASWEAPTVQRLIADDRVSLTNLYRADAYVALYPFLSKVTVPAGVGDLAKHLPPTDVTLLAPTASLVVRKTLHPAIQYLLLNTAVQIHSGVGMFHRAGRFPAAEGIDLPLSDVAVQFYKSGQPFLQNILPFWAASLVGRLLILLIPILGVLYPTVHLLPTLYNWLMRSRISRLYGELKFLENEIEVNGPRVDTNGLTARLNKLEMEANALKVPIAYVTMMYLLREQVAVVRERLKSH
jgi:TRAP transporter TAXI family solute receptor